MALYPMAQKISLTKRELSSSVRSAPLFSLPGLIYILRRPQLASYLLQPFPAFCVRRKKRPMVKDSKMTLARFLPPNLVSLSVGFLWGKVLNLANPAPAIQVQCHNYWGARRRRVLGRRAIFFPLRLVTRSQSPWS